MTRGLALEWYERAADKGSLWGAQRAASLLLAKGDKEDEGFATEYLEKAATRGDKAAACRAGALYLSLDPAESLKMFKMCGDQSRLAYFYTEGVGGVAQDFDKAVELCQNAAAGGDDEARHALAGIDPKRLGRENVALREAITRWATGAVKKTKWYAP